MQPVDLMREFNHLSPVDLEDIMEWLRDQGFLNKEGISFSLDFWDTFIKRDKRTYPGGD